jgi:hypothetical protein
VTTYDNAARLLAEAQEVLDRHATSSATGLCVLCGHSGPCPRRETAAVIFSRYHRLPRRLPGASRPELNGARRIDTTRPRVGVR